ncbi:peptide chain release factor N(5)-glutamine methyltransferase [Patescibacteria group bacterium]|nr:peptide chain release factor N(5)-glutamine methyltransferase [Patescibacteria group bacterium]
MISSKPYQYIKGWVEFYKLKFKVTPDVLIPRPETELLVDAVLNSISEGDVILDLGTGAGNIAVSIAKNAPDVEIIATDISDKALKIARQNARLYGVEKQIQFIKSNLLKNLHRKPDIIVTNLPYIPSERIPYLDSSVKDFEPHIALDGGKDGFDLYRKLFAQIKERGWHPKFIIGEIDYTHGELAILAAQKYFPNAEVEVKKDLVKKQRLLIIKSY